MNMHAAICLKMSGKDINGNYISDNEKTLAQRIHDLVCLYEEITSEELHDRGRQHYKVRARNVYFYLVRMKTNITQADLGRQFDMDHTTIIHGLKMVNNAIKTQYWPITSLIHKIENALAN